ncbi:NUDIX hydrolase [Haloarcula onubensis]|uniref:NUDIX domain-containing protein n=1 Tax=Haloarcula onubensis TaxID=2950539 RepID=A0ABU2FTJ8_9EURY|nr:NUDIX domain-containing protein [Halomicroarcula sp. S3CR25-11]MDS0284088.1 NUDIX domain-containing protein [Halomicroarcula sp. S3CR25-11]
MEEQFLRPTISIRGVVCLDDETVLTIRRASDGVWELPGGRIRRSEAVEDCLRREVAEETGLAVTVHSPVEAVTWQNDAGEDRFAVYYRCTTAESDVSLSGEHTDAEWLGASTARRRLSEPQAVATRRACDHGSGERPVRDD